MDNTGTSLISRFSEYDTERTWSSSLELNGDQVDCLVLSIHNLQDDQSDSPDNMEVTAS